jgi:hypothetical protein
MYPAEARTSSKAPSEREKAESLPGYRSRAGSMGREYVDVEFKEGDGGAEAEKREMREEEEEREKEKREGCRCAVM